MMLVGCVEIYWSRFPNSTLLIALFIFGGVSLFNPNIRKKGILITKGLLGNQGISYIQPTRGSLYESFRPVRTPSFDLVEQCNSWAHSAEDKLRVLWDVQRSSK